MAGMWLMNDRTCVFKCGFNLLKVRVTLNICAFRDLSPLHIQSISFDLFFVKLTWLIDTKLVEDLQVSLVATCNCKEFSAEHNLNLLMPQLILEESHLDRTSLWNKHVVLYELLAIEYTIGNVVDYSHHS